MIQAHDENALAAPHIVVCIPTFRRPQGLINLLRHLNMQTTPASISVIVADNDATGRQGIAALSQINRMELRFDLKAVVADAPGLSSVRNTLLAEALKSPAARFIAMIDDDEWPEPQWLERLVAVQCATGADIVGAPVHSVFEKPASPAVAACRLFHSRLSGSGPVDIVWATNNVLLTRDFIAASGPHWFDDSYGLTGGEDSDFFIKHHMLGRKFAWCAEAAVHEHIPVNRARFTWIAKRAFRVGSTNAHIQRRRRFRGRTPAGVMAVALSKLATALIETPFRALHSPSRADALCDLAEAFGMLYGAFGFQIREYAR
jgi:glycosyltransferase involved in cell wall biosynthesis